MITTNKTPTIYDIKYATMDKSPYYFDRKSMKFFGQTMRDFKVKKSPTGRIYIYAKTKTGSYSFREFTNGNNLKALNIEHIEGVKTLSDIISFINTH
jgi:uncharacterized protein (DUF2252 family)